MNNKWLLFSMASSLFLVNVVLPCLHTGLLLITLDLIIFTFYAFALYEIALSIEAVISLFYNNDNK